MVELYEKFRSDSTSWLERRLTTVGNKKEGPGIKGVLYFELCLVGMALTALMVLAASSRPWLVAAICITLVGLVELVGIALPFRLTKEGKKKENWAEVTAVYKCLSIFVTMTLAGITYVTGLVAWACWLAPIAMLKLVGILAALYAVGYVVFKLNYWVVKNKNK